MEPPLLLLINGTTTAFSVHANSSGQNPDADEVEEMVDEADADGSGSINFPEFIELMLKKQQGGQTKDEIKQVSISFIRQCSITISTSSACTGVHRLKS